ncbi:MAG: hypothetical protein J1E43_05065 [Christensenellaceae bacterium]|nr:hypothetical protein [Christensenellaceae bacterium]
MENVFDKAIFHGCLIKGDVAGAMQYLAHFPEQAELYQRYVSVFEKEAYPALSADARLNAILTIYQKYYRDVFYLHRDAEQAAEAMKDRFRRLFGLDDADMQLGALEKGPVAGAFEEKGYHFLGGKTGGHWGPYIWKTIESKTFEVELPDGRQPYLVRFLDGFLSKGWYDAVSFGAISTGGWTDGDGVIQCVKSSYDLEAESFTVSLLKHEAQHVMDLSRYPHMSSEELEYRAKLVELIYSSKRNLLRQFIQEADDSEEDNGHSLAADRIKKGFENKLRMDGGQLSNLSIADIQRVSKALFAESNEAMRTEYAGD